MIFSVHAVAALPAVNLGTAGTTNTKYCGDGIVNQASEECDGTAGIPAWYYICTSNCKLQLKNLTCAEAISAGLLTGQITGGKATVINHGNKSYNVGLAVYKKFDEIIDNQIIFDYDSKTVGINTTVNLSVDLPDCKYQIDLFCGPVLMSLNGTRYGARIMAYQHVGTKYCTKEYCGDGIVNQASEECDGTAGIPAWYYICTSNCKLQLR